MEPSAWSQRHGLEGRQDWGVRRGPTRRWWCCPSLPLPASSSFGCALPGLVGTWREAHLTGDVPAGSGSGCEVVEKRPVQGVEPGSPPTSAGLEVPGGNPASHRANPTKGGGVSRVPRLEQPFGWRWFFHGRMEAAVTAQQVTRLTTRFERHIAGLARRFRGENRRTPVFHP